MSTDDPNGPQVDREGVQLPLIWIGVNETPIEFANTFVLQEHEGEVILVVGQIAPPMIFAQTQTEFKKAAKNLTHVPIRTVGRYGFTEARAREFLKALQEHVEKIDARREGRDAPSN